MISVAVAIVLALGGTTISGYTLASKYRRGLEYNYQRALNDLGSYVTNIESTLTKAIYANTPPEQNGIAVKLMREASGAKAALSVLPLKSNELTNINKFIAQVGDYANVISKKVATSTVLTEQDMKTLEQLNKYALSLTDDLQKIETKYSEGKIFIGEPEKGIKNLQAEAAPAFSEQFQQATEDFVDYPTLIYDGPFSDHIGQRKPLFLSGKKIVLQGNAENTAADFFGVKADQISHTNDTEGGMPTYNFNYEKSRICITKAGGYVATMFNSREVKSSKLGYKDAAKKAQEFFKSRDIKNMTESYYVINDNICTLNYAYSENGITYYPDLIKVAIALDNGEIIQYNATGYLMNHHVRELPQKRISIQAAENNVSKRLKIQKGSLAVIPTPGLNEVLCYEFLCTGKGNEKVLVYINTATGYEQQILIIIASDQGVLVK